MNNYKFSVIIPTVSNNTFLLKCLNFLNQQSFKNFEVLLVSENDLKSILNKDYFFNLRIINKQIFTPGKKRNYAASIANGEYLCFIDDDAYPGKYWLEEANNFFLSHDKFPTHILLGGPGVIPEDDNFFSKCSNLFFCSIFTGISKSKYLVRKKYESFNFDDWPSANMSISKKSFLEIGGFDDNYWPGEDSKLCLNLINSSGKIVYRSNFKVFHYRRSSFLKHFKQIFRYSYTRGLFFQNKDQNSRKFLYVIPTLFMFYVFFLPLLTLINIIFIIPILIFLLLLVIDLLISVKLEKNFMVLIFSRLIIFLSFICYGFGFFLSFINKKIYLGLGR